MIGVSCGPQTQNHTPPAISSDDEHNRVYQEACDIINPYLRLHGKDSKSLGRDGSSKIRRAISMLDAVTAYHQDNWSAYWIKGKAYQALEQSREACTEFKRAFDLQDKNPDVAREYMFECLNLGDGAEGLRAARHAVSLDTQSPGLHANLALAYLVAGQPSAAIKAVDESLRLDPSDSISQNVRRVAQQILDGKRPIPKTLHELGN